MKPTKFFSFISITLALTNIFASTAARAELGLGVGVQSGAADGDPKTNDVTYAVEYFTSGSNPKEGGRGYGLANVKVGYSGPDTGGGHIVSLESRGLGGWQIIKAGAEHPVMFHLGIEPTNFLVQTNTNLLDDVKNRLTKATGINGTDKALAETVAPGSTAQLGDPNAPIKRQHYAFYMPMLSAGVDMHFLSDSCRILALGRIGAALGGQLRTDGDYSAGGSLAYGAGAYLNCPGVNVGGEWTHIAQQDKPLDVLNADLMVKPFKKIPLGVGGELGSMIASDNTDAKSVPSSGGKSTETHGGGFIRVIF